MTRRGGISALRLIVPKKTSLQIAHRMAAVDSSVPLELFEYDSAREVVEQVDPNALGNLSTFLVPHREAQALLDRARSALESIINSARQKISVHPVVPSREVFWRFRGLSFARWAVVRVDAALDPRYVYSQVFASAGGEHGILDLLGVTRSGRLVIIELKASEHVHLPVQAADYWLRVRRHLEQGDFERHGYFPRLHLQAAPPLVYLVGPALHFHPATDILTALSFA